MLKSFLKVWKFNPCNLKCNRIDVKFVHNFALNYHSLIWPKLLQVCQEIVFSHFVCRPVQLKGTWQDTKTPFRPGGRYVSRWSITCQMRICRRTDSFESWLLLMQRVGSIWRRSCNATKSRKPRLRKMNWPKQFKLQKFYSSTMDGFVARFLSRLEMAIPKERPKGVEKAKASAAMQIFLQLNVQVLSMTLLALVDTSWQDIVSAETLARCSILCLMPWPFDMSGWILEIVMPNEICKRFPWDFWVKQRQRSCFLEFFRTSCSAKRCQRCQRMTFPCWASVGALMKRLLLTRSAVGTDIRRKWLQTSQQENCKDSKRSKHRRYATSWCLTWRANTKLLSFLFFCLMQFQVVRLVVSRSLYVLKISLRVGCPISDTPAVPFPAALEEFDSWLQQMVGKGLQEMGKDNSGTPEMVFVTCGDWDCKHVRTQCQIWKTPVPTAFSRWINIKRSYSDSYGGDFRGMKSMQLGQTKILFNRVQSIPVGLARLCIYVRSSRFTVCLVNRCDANGTHSGTCMGVCLYVCALRTCILSIYIQVQLIVCKRALSHCPSHRQLVSTFYNDY